MLSVTIPEKIQCDSFFAEMQTLILNGVKGFEVRVQRALNKQLMISMNHTTSIYLNDVLSYIARQKLDVILVLNFVEPYIEVFALSLVRKWDLQQQIRYTGKLMPEYLNVRERQYIHYDVENCLPNYYHLSTIKRTHLDVIHYFMRKHKVTILRMHESGVTVEVLNWATVTNTKLSIYGVETIERAQVLLESGVGFVSALVEKISGHELQKKD